MQELFLTSFWTAADFLAAATGYIAAAAIYAAAALMILGIAAALFDGITSALAYRWHRKGRRPKGRIGRVIYGSHDDNAV